jgi:hypothetical protein
MELSNRWTATRFPQKCAAWWAVETVRLSSGRATGYCAAAKYYAKTSPELGVRFYDEIDRLIRDIRQDSNRYPFFDPPIRGTFHPFSRMRCFRSIDLIAC